MVDLRLKKKNLSPKVPGPLYSFPNDRSQEKEWEGKPSQLEATPLELFPEIRAHLGERQESGSYQSHLHFPILLLTCPTPVPAGKPSTPSQGPSLRHIQPSKSPSEIKKSPRLFHFFKVQAFYLKTLASRPVLIARLLSPPAGCISQNLVVPQRERGGKRPWTAASGLHHPFSQA